MTKSEDKAIEMVDKYGELAPDVINEVLSIGLLYKSYAGAMSKQSLSFWMQTKIHCEFLLDQTHIKREVRLKKLLNK
ncbi:MAG: hypothetical protein SLAVMIC_00553 [uncultured marine phage]|uniref:Uncharacterized protein n=1 Tax=uncultured marine phage TaxID=707152 RepID=A0A8D9FR66_9VIRU|nr:MAG: hypothetical protein SLAVMIC_00553 [uncultured marine phage]